MPFPQPRRATAKLDMIAPFIMIKLFEQRIAAPSARPHRKKGR